MALAFVGGAAAFAGCGGDEEKPGEAVTPPTTTSEEAGAGDAATTKPSDCIKPACADVALPENAHVQRLSNTQWELTVRDLLKLAAVPGNSATFPPDPVGSAEAFGTDANALQVTDLTWVSYRTAAEALADLVTGDDVALGKLLPAGAQTGAVPARMTAFVTDFLPRAYRRPVTAKEITDVIAAAELSASLVSTGDDFKQRVRWTLATVLQSPDFLYKVYVGRDDKVANKRARLSQYELASKLSYGIWNTMPDDALVARAKAGELDTTEGVAKVARDMLADPRASDALLRFHDLLYLTDHYAGDLKSQRAVDVFPTYYPELADDAAEDVRRSVKELVISGNGGFKELSTSTTAYVNQRLAAIYDIDKSTIPELANAAGPDTWVKIQMNPAQRKGVMLHVGWLADKGTGNEPSLIHRGVYIARHITCQELGSPPPGAAGANIAAAPGNTNRERVYATTTPCGQGCHMGKGGIINPMGSSFEAFDSIGKVRATDNNFPLDTAATTDLLGGFTNAADMFEKISVEPRAHACYVAHWSAFLNSTSKVDVTPRWLSPALAKSLKGGSVRDIIIELVQTDAFLTISR